MEGVVPATQAEYENNDNIFQLNTWQSNLTHELLQIFDKIRIPPVLDTFPINR